MQKNLFRKGIIIGIILLFVGASVVPSTGMEEKSTIGRAIFYVGGSGPGNYTTIQAAINDANSGDTVFVYNGTYHENVVITKNNIILKGEDKNNTIIDASGGGIGLAINTCLNVLVKRFSITNSSGGFPNGNGVRIYSNGNCNYNIISDCLIYNNSQNGVLFYTEKHMNGDNNKVINCELFNNGNDGISMSFNDIPASMSSNEIWYTKCYNNSRFGILTVWHTYGINHIISNCVTYNNGDDGIYINGRGNQILNSSSYNNGGNGVALYNAYNGAIINCTFKNNSEVGINSTYDGGNNLIYHNNLINNNPNAVDSFVDIWYSESLEEGNYYDDYAGEDNNGDGIGDTPYNISGGSNQDLYPLMYPWYPTHPDTVYVDDDYDNSTPGWGYDRFNRIQYGINEVEGSTVYVYNGTYYENVVVDKSINLVGEDRNSTIIDGGGSGDVVYVSVNWVNVSGFTIRNSGSAGYPNYDAGVEIRSNYSNIIGNIVTGNNRGIWISANNNYVVDNEITSNNAQGIEIYLSRNNTIAGNNVSSNTKAGIQSDNSSNNTITSNTVTSNNWHGIFLDDFSSSNTITSNNISSNDNGICIFDSSDSNIIYHNNFIDNTQNAYDECTNTWHNSPFGEGNYYDDYTGEDIDGDGIGNTPYNISGGDNQDLYPLMHPFELYFILDIILENSEVDEGTDFKVVIKSEGGTIIPNAIVEFNDELKTTALTGTVHFTAPQVGEDTYYDIIADKDGYTGDTETILVKDVPVEFVSTFMYGRITNLNTTGEHITFEAVNVRTITLSPFSFISYTSGELITILKDYTGLLGALFGVQFIFATCDASIG